MDLIKLIGFRIIQAIVLWRIKKSPVSKVAGDKKMEAMKKFLRNQRVNNIVIGSIANTAVNTACELATFLGAYLGGSRRFPCLAKENSDLDIFFEEKNVYEIFCKYLARVGSRYYEDWVRTYTREKREQRSMHGYNFEHVEDEIVKENYKKYYPGMYILGGINFHIHLVEKIFSQEEEIEFYYQKILDEKIICK